MRGELLFANNESRARRFISSIERCSKVLAVYVIGSTKTSTIPGISVAGASPEATLYTPALDSEYLVLGRTASMKEIPVTPEGIPTPALLTRVVLELSKIPYLVVDSGSFLEPKIPKVSLPSKSVGGRIDEEEGLKEGTAKKLYEEGRILARSLFRDLDVVLIGESIPGGTTTALAIMVSLGYEAWGLVSSAGPKNPLNLKESVVREGLSRCRDLLPTRDPFLAVDCMGDPVHISMAGMAFEAINNGVKVVLAGGTQMGAVLAILKRLEAELKDRVIIGTTRWIVEDPSSDIVRIVRLIDPEVPVVAFNYDFSSSPFDGLKYYEKGYVKEGVGAGGTALLAHLVKKLPRDRILSSVYEEYRRILGK